MRNFITLLTDFGLNDHYVAVLKGVIYSICPQTLVIDITHNIPKFNVKMASHILYVAYKYFPKNTIHSVTVYPEVGTDTKALIIKTRNYLFVGPDNGVLSLAAKDDHIEEVFEIVNKDFMLEEMSYTFHGRDIFAPVPAFLACGVKPEEMGVPVDSHLILSIEKSCIKDGSIKGEIIHIDGYGNVITNIGREQLEGLDISAGDILEVQIGVIKYELRLVKTFSNIKGGEVGLVVDSENLLELCIFKDSAAKTISANIGDKVKVKKISEKLNREG